jgi:hypothetical protein
MLPIVAAGPVAGRAQDPGAGTPPGHRREKGGHRREKGGHRREIRL